MSRAKAPIHQGFAGAHGDFVEAQVKPAIAKDVADKIVITDRCTAKCND